LKLEVNKRLNLGPFNLKFIYFLLDNNLYTKNNILHLKNIVNELILIANGSRQERLTLFNCDNIERLFMCKSSYKKRPFTTLVDTNINNKFINSLLDDFYKGDLYNSAYISVDFVKKFSESHSD